MDCGRIVKGYVYFFLIKLRRFFFKILHVNWILLAVTRISEYGSEEFVNKKCALWIKLLLILKA